MMTALLDLSGLRRHVKEQHLVNNATLPTGMKPMEVARWHAQQHGGKYLIRVPHAHGGVMISIEFDHSVFSNHPEGWFTGQQIDEPITIGRQEEDSNARTRGRRSGGGD